MSAAPRTMRAVVLTGHGGLDKLEYRDDVPVPVPAADEVRIAVSACGINNTDVNTRTGWYSRSVTAGTGEAVTASDVDGSWGGALMFPRIQGADPVGRIDAVGADVPAERIGERVLVDGWLRDPDGVLERARYLGSEVDGGFAQYVTVPSGNAHRVDSDWSDVELASIPCSYATAEHMLHRAGVVRDQWVLVTGASGGVGGALVQLARRRGAKVVAVTSEGKQEAVRGLGAEVVLARTRGDLAEAVVAATGGVDVFADVVGGDGFASLLPTIRRGGHYTTAGAVAGPVVPLDLRILYLHDLTFHGATVLPPEVFAALVGYVERGEIRPVVARTFDLADLATAQEVFMSRAHVGAIVVEIDPPVS
ncbi:MAG TPA: alcohol dehydrogenase family protein [Euzebyales bacterium]